LGVFGQFGASGPRFPRGFYINPRRGGRAGPEGPPGPPRALPDPGRGLGPGPQDPGWEPGASPGPTQGAGEPGSPVSGIRTPRRGLFYINPSRRGPVPARGSQGSPPLPGRREPRRPPLGLVVRPASLGRGILTTTGKLHINKNRSLDVHPTIELLLHYLHPRGPGRPGVSPRRGVRGTPPGDPGRGQGPAARG